MSLRRSRRDFLKGTTSAVVLGAAGKAFGAPLKSLPKRRLGKTGEMVPCLGFGAGNRFCAIEDEAAAQALLERAFNLGITYLIRLRLTLDGESRDSAKNGWRIHQAAAQADLSCRQGGATGAG